MPAKLWRKVRRNLLRRGLRTSRGPRRSMRLKRGVGGYSATTHLFKRKTSLGPLVVGSGGNGYLGSFQTFQLNLLPNSGEFTVLFDQYTIRRVKFYIVMRASMTTLVESAVNLAIGMPNIICVKDYDDATAPASSLAGYNELQEYANSRSHYWSAEKRVFKVNLKPAVLGEVFRSAIATTYSPKWNQKIDCVNPDVPHYGVRFVISVPSSGLLAQPVTFDLFATYYFAMHNVR